ncbi:hypothetical protein D3C85_1896040 [compost metagenome]
MVASRSILLELIGFAFELELPLADASGRNQERHAEMIRLLKVIGELTLFRLAKNFTVLLTVPQ